jgi:acyl-CoA oxidase
MKFWIGAAGNVANIAVVWAQLYIDGKCHGVHVYLVPLRDSRTHDPLPGVTLGDCGPKNALNEVDNGFILFDNVRIPRINQLGKLSGVDSNGKYYSTINND